MKLLSGATTDEIINAKVKLKQLEQQGELKKYLDEHD